MLLFLQYTIMMLGIGRDDAEDLIQKQSHSLDDTIRVYINTLATSNIGNAGTFTLDESYVLLGHNTGRMCATAGSIAEIPIGLADCDIFSRIEREWKVTKTNHSQNFNLDLTLNDCAILGSVVTDELRLLVDDNGDFSDGGTSCYYNGDGTGIVISYASPVVTISNISNTHIADNGTSYITLASISTTPLNIELNSFNATPVNNCCVYLDWTTSSEKNNDYFLIERSSDAKNWHFLSEVSGAGTSSNPIDYDLEDKRPLPNTSYYRLSQVNFDGTLTIEGVRSVVFNKGLTSDKLTLYPNPTSDIIHISGEEIDAKNLTLLNALGQIVSVEISEDANGIVLIDLSSLASGVYILQDSKQSDSYRIIKE